MGRGREGRGGAGRWSAVGREGVKGRERLGAASWKERAAPKEGEVEAGHTTGVKIWRL